MFKVRTPILVSLYAAKFTSDSVFTSVFFPLSLVSPGLWAMVRLGKSTKGNFLG